MMNDVPHNNGTTRAVILARGLGTRMRKADTTARLDTAQAAAADNGVKGMIPIGRPFMDYLISALADAGFTDVCLVIGPEHGSVRQHYTREVTSARVRIQFAIQERPLGTADAVLAAEGFAAGQTFVVINSDNYYPVGALTELRKRTTPALIAFECDTLNSQGNVTREKLARFGILDIGEDGYLRRILASSPPDPGGGPPSYTSLNCWLFTAEIFRACREVPLSARGESELPQAVVWAIERQGMRFEAIRMSAPALDMSSRADIASVAERLREVSVAL